MTAKKPGRVVVVVAAKPPPKKKPNCTIIDAIEAKKLAIVMIATSRLAMWRQLVGHDALELGGGEQLHDARSSRRRSRSFCERPIANALGIAVCATATRGLGRSAWMQRRSIIACSSGASCGETSRAPMARSAILSEVNNCSSEQAAGDDDDRRRRWRRRRTATPMRTT